MKLPSWVIPGSAVLFCAGCAALQSPAELAHGLAETAGFSPAMVADDRLRAFARNSGAGGRLTIYIESDGAPWRFPDEPPADPTPLRPLVMRMAAADPTSAVAYLGRPCQYLSKQDLRACNPDLWMHGRFSEDAVSASNRAVDQLKKNAGAAQVNLVGYSGGGAMAALIAARRSDISCLVTIAAPLDTNAWTDALGVSRLDGSFNPADVADKLRNVRQTHFRGGQDRTVPPATVSRFLDRAGGPAVIDKPAFDHRCCWDVEWQTIRKSSCLAQ